MKYFIGAAIFIIGFLGFRGGMYYKDLVWKRRIKKALNKSATASELEAVLLPKKEEEIV